MPKAVHRAWFMAGALCITVVLGACNAIAQVAPSKTFSSIAKIDCASDGRIHIFDEHGSDFVPPAEQNQVGCADAEIATNRQAAAWLVNYKNCCTSYPVPLTLVIYQPGKPLLKLGDELMLGEWHFLDGGKRVAFYSNTVHPNGPGRYELHDVTTGRLLGKWSGDVGKNSPKWTNAFDRP